MIGSLRPRELVVIGAALTAGVAGTTVALGNRGADAQFLQDQRHPPNLRAADVERVVRSAPDPLSGKGHAVAATCARRGSGQLGNPWSCVVRYPSGKRYRLAVRVQQDGYYDGRYVGVKGAAATGCCIDLPGTK
jgi:hypothetical protein